MAQQDLTMDDFVKQFHMQLSSVEPSETMKSDEYKKLSIHPNDESISLTVHTPLYPPGRYSITVQIQIQYTILIFINI